MNKNMNRFWKLLLGTGLYLLEQSDGATKKARERAAGQFEDLRDVAQEKYGTVADRMAKASRAIRGEDRSALHGALYFAAGTGLGIGLGLIFAPGRGEDTRNEIAGRVHEMGDKVRRKFSPEGASATGTNG